MHMVPKRHTRAGWPSGGQTYWKGVLVRARAISDEALNDLLNAPSTYGGITDKQAGLGE